MGHHTALRKKVDLGVMELQLLVLLCCFRFSTVLYDFTATLPFNRESNLFVTHPPTILTSAPLRLFCSSFFKAAGLHHVPRVLNEKQWEDSLTLWLSWHQKGCVVWGLGPLMALFYGSVCVDTVVCEQTQDMRVREWGTSVDWAGERAPVGVNSPVWLHFLFCRRDAITTSLLITLLAPVLLPAPLRYLHRLLSLFLSPVLFNGRSQHRC